MPQNDHPQVDDITNSPRTVREGPNLALNLGIRGQCGGLDPLLCQRIKDLSLGVLRGRALRLHQIVR